MATDIYSAQDLKNALGGNASISGNVVTLSGNVELTSSLVIKGGTMTLDLNGKSIEFTSKNQDSKAIICDGANVLIKGNGKIKATAKWNIGSFSDRYNAITLTYNSGMLLVYNGTFLAEKYFRGSNYTLDPNNGKYLRDMVPYGAFVKGDANYDSQGIESKETIVELSTYDAIFDLNGGSGNISNIQSYTLDNGKFSYPAQNPVKKGYVFNKWTLSNGTTIVNNIPVLTNRAPLGEVRLTAQWQIQEYKVSYNTNGGDNHLSAGAYTIENGIDELPSPGRKVGYIFEGWYNQNGEKVTSIPKGSIGNVTLTAHWIKAHTITYNTNGGSDLTNPVTEFTKETETFDLPKTTKKYYLFKGWYDKKNTLWEKVTKGTDQDLSLTAKWLAKEYTLDYITNINNVNLDAKTFSKELVPENLFPNLTGKKKGYAFAGWYKQENWGGNKLSNMNELFPEDENQKNVKIYAKWVKDTYTVTLELNGGTGSNSLPYTIEDEKTLEKPARNGYKFEGWYKDEHFKEAFGDKINKGTTGNFTLYVKWSPMEYTIDYKLSENESFDGQPAKYTIEQTITLPVPVESGYDFIGWYEEAAPQTLLKEFNSDKNQFGNKEFFAKFEATEYKVTFDMKGGFEMASVPFTIESKGVKFKTPKKDGCKFLGWFEDEACTKEYGMELKESSIGDFTLYAKWQAIGYSISYEYLYDGSLPANAPKNYTIDQVVTLPIPTRPGYIFVGWHDKDQTEGVWGKVIDYTFNAEKNQIGNKTFYAEWKGGLAVIIRQPKEGTIRVKNLSDNKELQSGAVVDAGTRLEITTTPSSSYYALDKIIVNGKVYGYSPCTVTVPDSCGLSIAATFTDGRPTVSKPEIFTDPENVEIVALGQYVWVSMRNTDEEAQLLYSIGGSDPQPYKKPIQVTSASVKDLEVRAISRKPGYKDGVQTKMIHYKSGRITITFDLPYGISAFGPDGGDVISVVATGGIFEFKLACDKEIIASTENMHVVMNDKDFVFRGHDDVYRISNVSENVTIKVVGAEAKQYTLSLIQTEGGEILFGEDGSTGEKKVNAKSSVPVKAIPDEGYYFKSWSDGNKNSEREVFVSKDMNLSANFSKEHKVYRIVFPEMDGVKLKTLSAYSDEVQDGGTCKFYLRLDKEYDQSKPVVYANGKKIDPVKDVYSLYYIHQHYSISVTGVKKNQGNPLKVSLPENVECRDILTGKNVSDIPVYEDRMVMITAKAPEGKVFNKWNDNNKSNPRIVKLIHAAQYLPMWKDKSEEKTFKLSFSLLPGCGVATEDNLNAEAILADTPFKFRLNVLSDYSQSENIAVKIGEQELLPMTELRSSSASRTLYYLVEKVDKNMTVTVSGLTENQYQLKLEQTKGGEITASTTTPVTAGTNIIVTAEPDKDYMFLRWSDGNTLNPYTYEVKGDTTLKAEFIKARDMVLDNEDINISAERIYVMYNQLHIESLKVQELFVYSYSGALIKQVKVGAGHSFHQLPTGDYIVRLGKTKVQKIFIK